jgi:flagellar motility protein MotE (MotC chaperone)
MHSHLTLLALAGVAALLLGTPPAFADDTAPEPESRREWCQQNPEKCQEIRGRRQAFCQENPEQCERIKQRRAERRARCQQDPEACEQRRAEWKQRRAERKARCEADPVLCEQRKQERRERIRGGKPPEEPH